MSEDKAKNTTIQQYELAQKAAAWWADKLRKPVARHKLEHGGGGEYTATVNVMMSLLGTPNIAETEAEDFQKHLTQVIWVDFGKRARTVFVDVDYHPCRLLAEALRLAGINEHMNMFPLKTTMCIDFGNMTISVSEGYGSEAIEI